MTESLIRLSQSIERMHRLAIQLGRRDLAPGLRAMAFTVQEMLANETGRTEEVVS